jgi:CBS-domain-containing membrane protein
MNSNIAFIIKVVLLSAAVSLAIKYVGPILSIPPSNAIAFITVLTPSLTLAAILSWKALKPVKSS